MPTTLESTIAVFEYALVFAGLGVIAWLGFHPAGRAARGRPAALPRWDIRLIDFLALAWLVLALGLCGQLLLRVTVGGLFQRSPDAETLELVTYGCMFHVGAIVTWFAARAWVRRREARAGAPAAIAPPATGARGVRDGTLALLAAIPLVTAADLLWEPFLKLAGLPLARQELVDMFLAVKSPLVFGWMVVVALVVAPVGEEIAFRAGLYRYLRGRAPQWVALAVSASLFAAVHGNWVSFLPLFVLGVVFALAYERTGLIAVPIVAHALFNLNSLLLVLGGGGK